MLPPPASGDLKSHPELSARRTAHMSVMWVHHQFTRFEVSRPSHSTTSFMDPFFCNCGTKSNYCQLPSYIHHTATYLSLPPYLSYYNSTLPSFFLYSSSNLLLPTLISIFRLDALAKALSVIATATWLGGWLAVTLRYCIKTAKPIGKLFRPSESPIALVF